MCWWQGAGRSEGMGLVMARLMAWHQLGTHRRVCGVFQGCTSVCDTGGWAESVVTPTGRSPLSQ